MTPLPLAGKRVVNTRALHQAFELDGLLRARGAEPVSYPCIDIAPPDDTAELDRLLSAAAEGSFDWLVLTSANTVLALARRRERLGLASVGLPGVKVAAIGPATARAASDWLGLETTLLPEEYVAESLSARLCAETGRRVLLPQSDIARPLLARELQAAGLDVAAVVAYRTVAGNGGANVPALLAAGQVDVVTFTSSSTVEHFAQRLTREGGDLGALASVCIACIGPVTARTAGGLGLASAVVPDEHTLDGLVNGLENYYLPTST